MAGYTCPFCNQIMSINSSTQASHVVAFTTGRYIDNSANDESIRLVFHLCPNCGEHSIRAHGVGKKTKGLFVPIYPRSLAKQFPVYVPIPIRQDYEEACAIVNLSPKASATLSRRCLQGMIRDFWKISKDTLAKEIDALEEKIPTAQWTVLNGVRRIGNIGAHMEKEINLIVDIEPDEANKLIKLIELLIQQWYIQRHEQEQLYADIIGIDSSKQNQRTGQKK